MPSILSSSLLASLIARSPTLITYCPPLTIIITTTSPTTVSCSFSLCPCPYASSPAGATGRVRQPAGHARQPALLHPQGIRRRRAAAHRTHMLQSGNKLAQIKKNLIFYGFLLHLFSYCIAIDLCAVFKNCGIYRVCIVFWLQNLKNLIIFLLFCIQFGTFRYDWLC
jgi:hypothetical protein